MERTAFLFKQGRKTRLEQAAAHPTEFFYGYAQLAAAGAAVELLDEADLGLTERIPGAWGAASLVSHATAGVHLWATRRLATPAALERLNRYAALVATTNTLGLSLAYLKRAGRLAPRVLFLAMGVVELTSNPLRRRSVQALLRDVETLVISKGEQARMRALLGAGARVEYVPFGVDPRFWTPGDGGAGSPYALSIGNDPHRDYATLIAAWRPEFPTLKIVTKLPLEALAPNIEIIAGDWRSQILSDEEIRELIRGARFVVVPVRETAQPSGQSVCLQAMACAKAVVISDISGLWDRALMVDDQSCVLAPCGSPDSLGERIAALVADPARAKRIGMAARAVVEDHLNVDQMAQAMRRIIQRAAPQPAGAVA